MYEITEKMAQQLVEFVAGETGYNMIVCDMNGVIIADNRKERLGILHPGAARIMSGEIDSIEISREDEIRSGQKMREGYNCVIKVSDQRIGTFGIGGAIEIVKPIAKISAAVIAARIKETQHLDLIREVVTEISKSVQQTAGAMEKIYASSEELAATSTIVAQAVLDADEKVSATNKVLDFILDVADRSKLLGLNAAIVAAQAGEHGRGFSVVADEVRKLATNSASSAEQITTILKEIQSAIDRVNASSEQTSAISVKQFQAMQEITGDIENIQKSVNLLVASVNRNGQ